ncbi:MAG: bifunctional helix-turn-helix domain-containing protein/methylated-DNA--[protein]-cysteine S-methyltransferase [Paracoccaceae bacterium]
MNEIPADMPPAGCDPARYALMARALAFIAANRTEQPSLDAVAAHVGLSPAHFQRAFSAWVGVSPKRYLQHLTLADARRLLAERASLLDASLETGLSGPSRLHDLFLRWEAMTPGDWAARGRGLALAWDTIETPFGEAVAVASPRGLAGLAFAAEVGREAALADLASRWPEARLARDAAALAPYAAALATPDPTRPVALALYGAPFQIKVWQALLAVPSGHLTTYAAIAGAVGNPRAVRAVGTAVGRNPISWLVPCHRAIRRDGGLGGYHWGLGVKRAMLAWESARLDGAVEDARRDGVTEGRASPPRPRHAAA